MEILKVASSRDLLNYVINRRSDPMYSLLPSISDFNFNGQKPRQDTEETFQQPTRPAEDVKILTKCL